MEITNYDKVVDFKSIHDFMPQEGSFRMLLCGPSNCGKTNTLMIMLMNPLLYYDKLYIYPKNLEQGKYKTLENTLNDTSNVVVYNVVLEISNEEIMNLDELSSDSPKIVVCDDYICEKNQSPLIKYFIAGRHKKCSVIYLSQSYFKTPKDIRSSKLQSLRNL